jgi:hypothetical protein
MVGRQKQITHDGRSAYPIWGGDVAFRRYNAKQPRRRQPRRPT